MQAGSMYERRGGAPTCPPLGSAVEYPPTEDGEHWVYGPWRWMVTCGAPVAFLDCLFPLTMRRSEEKLTHQATVARLVEGLGLSQARVAELVGVTRQTVNRWQSGFQIQRAHWSRLAAVADVVRRANERLATSDQVRKWLDAPEGMGGQTPAELMIAGDMGEARALAMSIGSSTGVASPSFLEAFGEVRPDQVREAHSMQFDELAEERLLSDAERDGRLSRTTEGA